MVIQNILRGDHDLLHKCRVGHKHILMPSSYGPINILCTYVWSYKCKAIPVQDMKDLWGIKLQLRWFVTSRNAQRVESSALTYWFLDRQDVIPSAWTPWNAMDPSEKRKTSCPCRKTKIPRFPRPQTNQDIDVSHSGSHNKWFFS